MTRPLIDTTNTTTRHYTAPLPPHVAVAVIPFSYPPLVFATSMQHTHTLRRYRRSRPYFLLFSCLGDFSAQPTGPAHTCVQLWREPDFDIPHVVCERVDAEFVRDPLQRRSSLHDCSGVLEAD